MKQFINQLPKCLSILMVCLLLPIQTSPTKATGIPVFDGSHIIETVAQILQLAEQIEQIYEQISLAEDHISKISGLRGMESLLESVYDNEIDSVLAQVDDILAVAKLLDAGTVFADEAQRFSNTMASENDLWDRENSLAARWQGQSEKYLNSTVTRFSELKKLISKLTGTPEQKDVLDLQARIASENSMLLNEQMKMDMVMSQLMAEEKMIERKRRQASIQDSRDDVNYDGLFEDIDWEAMFSRDEG